MLHALFQVVLTEMCVGSVCTQPPYNDKNPLSVFFFYLIKSLPLSQIEPISDACLCDVTWTEAPPTIVWLTVAFQHRLHRCLTSNPSWVSCHQLFHRRSRCSQECLPSNWGVLLLDVIMNIAGVIYSCHLSGWRWLGLVLKWIRPQTT